MTEFVTPPAMTPGDRVAVLAPSSGGARDAPHLLELALDRLRNVFDLDPVVYPTARQSNEFLSSHPEARAANLHAAFRDPEISGVFATVGGSDQLRVLRHLDPGVFREHPTRFYGMSDNTNLGLYLWREGVVSFNGAQLLNEIATPGDVPAYTEQYCRRAFFEDPAGELEPSDEWTDEPSHWWTDPSLLGDRPEYEPNPGWRWAGGDRTATGRLWGGCLSVLDWHLASDRYLPEPERLDGAVLCIETAEGLPSPDDVGGSLMAMGERGLLERFDAVLVGRPPTRSFAADPPGGDRKAYRAALYDAVAEQVARYDPDAPVVLGLDWGHTNPVAPIPVGREATVDPGERRLDIH
ncbi:S66 family peptidase [Halobacterium jilantaiense]|uniref:Muramoyltetrapeptide carboxypeptidase LdcA (Peptidoglycan recycling) n=1 Tax=Halobacterium jilantaiense TaxID=355548 RepID=A0A1I0NQD6_9EURY|nr:S66 peptidase family protein [Halobacterium jilantaiense]SEW03593.1 Muramoyltetrapeptide carboxypeptidase LdcA (peptidoglycan recycling) [Halobacterium jilantaiense]